MTCLTGPLGGSTCGRVGLPPNCAATGATEAAARTATTDHSAAFPPRHFIAVSASEHYNACCRPELMSPHFQYSLRDGERFDAGERSSARPDLVLFDAVQVQHA